MLDSSVVHRWLESHRREMVDQLIAWSNIGSGSRHPAGLRQMADRLVEDFAPLPADVRRVPLAEFETVDDAGCRCVETAEPALLWHCRPEAPRQVLLAIHMDTVYEPGDPPTECRWLDADRLAGPGVADAKGGLLVMLWALRALEQHGCLDGLGWCAVVNPDEELGSPASAELFSRLAPKFDFGLLFEPALPDGALVAARKGSGNFTVVAEGRAAHAGREPEAGRNAVVHLAKLVDRIDRLSDLSIGLSVNVGRFRGGTAANQVPDRAVARINARVVDAAQQRRVEVGLRELVAGADAAEGFHVWLAGGFHAPPKPADDRWRALQDRVERSGRRVGIPLRWRDTGGACDGNKLAAAGLPNIDTLGPVGAGLHSPDEFVRLDSLVPRTQLVAQILADYAADAPLRGSA